MEADFLELMPLTCLVAPRSGNSRYAGSSTFGEPVEHRCHIEYKAETITTREGVQKFQQGLVYLDGSYPYTTTYQLMIPIPGGTQEVEIIGVDQNTDEVGFHHTVLRFGGI